MTHGTAGLLLLADGRLPAGGYAHSGGLEAAVRTGRVRDTADLGRFLTGRATTTGATNAAFAAAACAALRGAGADAEPGEEQQTLTRLAVLDTELDARTPSPALRRVSHALGRQLLRALKAVNPHPLQQRMQQGPNHPVAFGAGAAMLGLTPVDAARGVLHESVSGPSSAVVKLMSADPFDAYRTIAELRGLLDEIAEDAAGRALDHPEDLPSYGAPLSDHLAEDHETHETRLFAS
ncbi:urease accessory protein UreF [Nocardiopsis kunsanensis]|uniref:Urease accessory protein UreF n=1 Tax=Nocardiopsis kunsanensis TaxID=141693 RepID=A0A919CN37_9ACTN|nr:urease accessory UreF family protein [Nocardiopsis kunsanensis]GHD37625.1 urease accessory protein UreF [Nocardiopsis kunsanensis]